MKKKKRKHTGCGQSSSKESGDDEFVTIDYNRGNADFQKVFNGQTVNFSIWGCKNKQDLEDKLLFFCEIINKYTEINEKAKEAIIEYFILKKNGSLLNYFYEVFDYMKYRGKHDHIRTFGVSDFHEVDIKKVVKNMNCSHISIYCKNGIDISLSFAVSDSEPYRDMYLLVNMNKYFIVTGFTEILD